MLEHRLCHPGEIRNSTFWVSWPLTLILWLLFQWYQYSRNHNRFFSSRQYVPVFFRTFVSPPFVSDWPYTLCAIATFQTRRQRARQKSEHLICLVQLWQAPAQPMRDQPVLLLRHLLLRTQPRRVARLPLLPGWRSKEKSLFGQIPKPGEQFVLLRFSWQVVWFPPVDLWACFSSPCLPSFSLVGQSATTSRAGGMRMAPGRGRGHLCWWPLIYLNS